jgi:hypothetical protein
MPYFDHSARYAAMPAKVAAIRGSAIAGRPTWDGRARQLWWRGEVVKTYWHDAANQRALRQAF